MAFLSELNDSNISNIFEIMDVNHALAYFIQSFNAIVNAHAPLKKQRIKDRTNPWFKTELSSMLQSKNKAWALAKKSGEPSHWLAFRQLRNTFTSAVRKAKSDYYLDAIISCDANPAKFWKIINTVRDKKATSMPSHVNVGSCVVSGLNNICTAFNEHFAVAGHIFENENENMTHIEIERHISHSERQNSQNNNFSLKLFTCDDVFNALHAIDSKKSTGEDCLDPFFLKLAAPLINEHITHIFNLSVSTGIVPNLWKMAHITPLHKGGDVNDRNNYRPISKLSCLGKTLEALVNDQLKMFLSNYSILNPFQSGFRAKHSTITATTLIVNDIFSAVDKRKHCAALFIDLSKAFDTVDFELLLNILHKTGFDGDTCSWFSNYLSGRSQCVKSGKAQSGFLPISKGVPQGSILGPILFTLYINNIALSLNNCKAHFYADDTIIYCIANSIQLATENLQLSFNVLQDSLRELKLVLNADKTKFMIFSRANEIDFSSLRITTLNGGNIDRVSEYKYLGIWLDDKFTFKYHIDNLACKLRQKIGFFYRNRASFPMACRKRVIEAVFLSVLDYGDVIYGKAAPSVLKPLDAVYHSALRFITGEHYRTHHCTLYERVGWPSLIDRRNKHWYLFIFKAIDGTLPLYLKSLMEWSDITYNTRSSDWLTLKIPRVNTELGKIAFCYNAPTTWNELQLNFKICSPITYNNFKYLVSQLPTNVCSCF